MKKTTISRKHAQSLHADISRLRRHSQLLEQELLDANKKLAVASTAADDLATQLNQKGEELGRAHQRVEQFRQIVDTALNGLALCAAGTSQSSLISTALALVRDGREQLRKASNGNGGHA